MNTLDKICADKREHIAAQKKKVPQAELSARVKDMPPVKGFRKALKNKVAAGKFALIAEVKKASPSKGIIRADFDPVAIANAYEAGGATCISVLTDTPYFQGTDEYFAAVRAAVELPLLRKDFMLDPYQMLEARAMGADCILLIMAALEDKQAAELEAASFDLGMDVLIEVHNEKELERAHKHLKSRLIGINNRNLKTLEVDLATTAKLARLLSEKTTGVCESGISSFNDLINIKLMGISCFLVGEALMREADVTLATKRLLGAA